MLPADSLPIIGRRPWGDQLPRLPHLCVRLPHLAHATLAEQGGDVVVAEAGAGIERHDLLGLLTGSFYAEAVHSSSRLLKNPSARLVL